MQHFLNKQVLKPADEQSSPASGEHTAHNFWDSLNVLIISLEQSAIPSNLNFFELHIKVLLNLGNLKKYFYILV
jgi:hypothetical protein